MTFPKARLVVSACLFLGWIAFLGYLVYDSRKVVLSKPQFMSAQVYVVAKMKEGRGGLATTEGTIVEVLWSADPADRNLVGQPVTLPQMVELQRSRSGSEDASFLLPLQKTLVGGFELAAVPHLDPRQLPTHGTVKVVGLFSHRVLRRLPLAEAKETERELAEAGFKTSVTSEELRVYPWTPDTRTQVDRLVAAKK